MHVARCRSGPRAAFALVPAAITVLGSLLATSADANAAPDKEKEKGASAAASKACIAELDKAQLARANRKLLEARTSYVSCSHESCPDMLRDDCSKGLREVDEALPTLVLSASLDGTDATDAKVTLDGERLTTGLDGRAITVDPGPHTVRFERQGSGPVELKFVAREGEKNRLVSGTFLSFHSEGGKVKGEGQRFPIVPVTFAGIGAIALGGAAIMHLGMTDRANELGRECAPTCAQSDRDALSDRLVLRNVTIGVGLGALAVAAVTYVVGLRR
jgi:hypothetical protein